MRQLVRPFLLLTLLGCAATPFVWAAPAQIPSSVEASQIPNYKVIAPGLAAAGQPSPEALLRLKELGFRTVINLRTAAEGTQTEEQVLAGLELRYVNVPVSPASFSIGDVEAVEKVLDDAEAGPILLHCASSNRVGGMWAVIQARRGKSLDEALAAGREAGLSSPTMEEAVRRVIKADKTAH